MTRSHKLGNSFKEWLIERHGKGPFRLSQKMGRVWPKTEKLKSVRTRKARTGRGLQGVSYEWVKKARSWWWAQSWKSSLSLQKPVFPANRVKSREDFLFSPILGSFWQIYRARTGKLPIFGVQNNREGNFKSRENMAQREKGSKPVIGDLQLWGLQIP